MSRLAFAPTISYDDNGQRVVARDNVLEPLDVVTTNPSSERMASLKAREWIRYNSTIGHYHYACVQASRASFTRNSKTNKTQYLLSFECPFCTGTHSHGGYDRASDWIGSQTNSPHCEEVRRHLPYHCEFMIFVTSATRRTSSYASSSTDAP